MEREAMKQEALFAVERLVRFGIDKQLVDPMDAAYVRNGLIDILRCDCPFEGECDLPESPETVTEILKPIVDYACAAGLCEDNLEFRDLLEGRIMGVLTPSPAEVRRQFAALEKQSGGKAATDWFYHMSCANDYIRVDRVARNIIYFADSPCGELEITINLSKPEKDPKEIARQKDLPQVGYPKCMLCAENPGYAGREKFPARQNHRIVPITLTGETWYLQYSPYKYYAEHCIVFCEKHRPMKIDRGSFERLAQFVDRFPHYFLGSNADLPIVGGSILTHDHFQGGAHEMPMDRAATECELLAPKGMLAEVVDWPMPTISLRGRDQKQLIDKAEEILNAWREYSDPELDILAYTEEVNKKTGALEKVPHNTITPIMHKSGDMYRLMLVLRNNRTSAEHELGIFHPHAPLHHIKKENIGLIEVMGLFILPGRLKTELKLCEDYLTGARPLVCPEKTDVTYKHFDWVCGIAARNGASLSPEKAHAVVQSELAAVCAQVLADAGVYKQDEAGRKGLYRFLHTVGLDRSEE